MDQRIPKHHVKQEICATRPAYREGRIPKAVKVYTINNESKYILIQGVPSVGATKELVKLCSSYGLVEEHHALDEYPCEDQYTEVYLVKYKKIQSARFAKRKLDDYSFFGGNLHVCYAPEYESVAETREKLQDRRRIIASKIRLHKNERQDVKALEHTVRDNENASSSSSPSVRESEISERSNLQIPTTQSFQLNTETNSERYNSLSQPNSSYSHKSDHEPGNSFSNFSHDVHSFVLPPPPKPSSANKHVEAKPKYEYSRVPSKHSTLPPDFDGRLPQSSDQSGESQNVSKTESQSETITETIVSKESLKIRKDYTPQKQTLRFVPRQAIKRKPDDSGGDGSVSNSSDEVDVKIRKNAFVLGEQQGPADLPGRNEKVPEITPGASKSYNNTIKSIRSKISQVITDSLMQTKK